MDNAERAFRDALHRVDSVRIPVPTLEPAEVRRTPGLGVAMSRWLAAAAVLAVVAGISVWALAGRGQTVTAVPAAPPSASAPVTLTGATWIAVELYGTPTRPVADPTRPVSDKVPTLEFLDASTFAGGDPCNLFRGTYRLAGDQLTLGQFSKTEIGCDAAQQELFDKALENTRRVRRDGDALELLDRPGSVLARFRSSVADTEPTPGTVVTPSAHPNLPTRAPAPTPTPTPTPTDPPATTVEIRIRNASSIDFEQVQVNFYDERVSYGDVGAGAESGYLATPVAYSLAFVQLTAGGKDYRLQPVDQVGETKLPPGRYTYVLDLDGGRLSLRLE